MLPSGSLGTLQTWDDRGEERALAQGPCAQHRVFGDRVHVTPFLSQIRTQKSKRNRDWLGDEHSGVPTPSPEPCGCWGSVSVSRDRRSGISSWLPGFALISSIQSWGGQFLEMLHPPSWSQGCQESPAHPSSSTHPGSSAHPSSSVHPSSSAHP